MVRDSPPPGKPGSESGAALTRVSEYSRLKRSSRYRSRRRARIRIRTSRLVRRNQLPGVFWLVTVTPISESAGIGNAARLTSWISVITARCVTVTDFTASATSCSWLFWTVLSHSSSSRGLELCWTLKPSAASGACPSFVSWALVSWVSCSLNRSTSQAEAPSTSCFAIRLTARRRQVQNCGSFSQRTCIVVPFAVPRGFGTATATPSESTGAACVPRSPDQSSVYSVMKASSFVTYSGV